MQEHVKFVFQAIACVFDLNALPAKKLENGRCLRFFNVLIILLHKLDGFDKRLLLAKRSVALKKRRVNVDKVFDFKILAGLVRAFFKAEPLHQHRVVLRGTKILLEPQNSKILVANKSLLAAAEGVNFLALGKMDDKGGRKNCFDVDNVKIWRKAFDFFLITFFAVEKHAAAKRELPAIDQLLVR